MKKKNFIILPLLVILTSFISSRASDDVDENVSVTYSAKDSSNNSASKTRTVNVIKKVVEAPLTLESNSTELNLGKSVLLTVKSGETQDVSSDVEWIVTPSDSAEMSNNILTAKKEGNVTVEAKYQGKTSNKLLFDVHWVINGHILPPEPDEAEDNDTVLGVDINENDVRDDVERWIYINYPEPLEEAVLMQSAYAYQKVIENPSEAHETTKFMDDFQSCKYYLIHNNQDFYQKHGYNINKEMKKIQFNTLERHIAYERYNASFHGEILSSPKPDKEKCNFDVDTLFTTHEYK